MSLDKFAEEFVSKLQIKCLVYDNRGFGSSDVATGQPRLEIIPAMQISDIQDAITYAQGLAEINPAKIGIWGSSFSGGHVLQVGAIDRRVKAVISQVPLVSGWETLNRLIRPDILLGMMDMFQGDRLARAAGKAPATIPVVSSDPLVPSSLPSADSFAFYNEWDSKLDGKWQNEITVRTIEACRGYDPSLFINRISPTPLLMLIMDKDGVTPTDLALSAYTRANEPKRFVMLEGGHFEAYSDPVFSISISKQIEFLQQFLCD